MSQTLEQPLRTDPPILAERTPIGVDSETCLIGPLEVAPPIVCLQASTGHGDTEIAAVADGDKLDNLADIVLEDSSLQLVFHNAPFDLGVLAAWRPRLLPAIFQALEDGRVSDTATREKLLNLATTGDLKMITNPDGSKTPIKYKLQNLVLDYLGVDRSADKEGDDDIWRLNYKSLIDTPSDQWPPDALAYAGNDPLDTLNVYLQQEQRRGQVVVDTGHDPFVTESLHVATSFGLGLMTCWGAAIDPVAKGEIDAMLADELSPEKLDLLIATGILRPGSPPLPYANGARDHQPDCTHNGKGQKCLCPAKMKKGQKESINKTLFAEYILVIAKDNPEILVTYTDASDRFPEGQVCTNAEWLDEYYHLDPVLGQFKHRQKLQKLVTTEMPRMCNEDGSTAAVVHPNYDVLKKTGRTSSYGGDLYPSFNAQNVDPRVRRCFVPRDGYFYFSVDYSQMELGTLAQKCLNEFGYSVMADRINAGVDVHAYTGSQLAYALNENFRDSCDSESVSDPFDIFKAFQLCNGSDNNEAQEFYDKYRKFAKPTNLGYPGGLGAETFIRYARATFEVDVDLELAKELKKIWKQTYPEMEDYFSWINKDCIDDINSTPDHKKFSYVSPRGLYRAGADYCAAANGAGLQTPSAEGAKLALFNIARGCYDPTMNSILCDDERGVACRPIFFVHDEIVGEVRDDELASDRVEEVGRIMIEAMRTITPDVEPRVEMSLMRCWDKSAKDVRDSNGKLVPWESAV